MIQKDSPKHWGACEKSILTSDTIWFQGPPEVNPQLQSQE